MKRKFAKLLCLLFCLCLLLSCLPACQSEGEEAVENGISSVRLTEKKRVELTVRVSGDLLRAHKKQTLCLYELLPGEGISVISSIFSLIANSSASTLPSIKR